MKEQTVSLIRRVSCAQIPHITKNLVEKQKSTQNTLYSYVSVHQDTFTVTLKQHLYICL